MIPTNPYDHVHVNEDLTARRKRRRRNLISIITVGGFVVGIILLLALTAGGFRTPKFRVRSATFGTNFNVQATNSSSFDILMNTEVGIRNRNFRRFRYRSTTVDFYYRERKVGEGFVWNDRVKGRDTRKFIVPVVLSSSNVTSSSELQNDLNGGVLPLRSRSRLTGKFRLFIFVRRYKHVNMDCTMDLVIPTRELTNISCR